MQDVPTPLGRFGQLPYEIRELIWRGFAPAGQGIRKSDNTRSPKTDLGILRTSRYLYNEVSQAIYRKSRLEFTISSSHLLPDPSWIWTVVTFNHWQFRGNTRVYDGWDERARATWRLKSLEDAKSRGFDCLPFHKLDEVVVNLVPCSYEDESSLFMLWLRVTELVKLLREATSIRSLVIQLQKGVQKACGYDHQDWLDWISGPKQGLHMRYDHDVAVLPFCTLRNLETIDIKAHSDQLKDAINWTVINWARKTVLDRSWNYYSSPYQPPSRIAENDVDRMVANNYLYVHLAAWYYPKGPTANRLRLFLLSHWFNQVFSGYSEFEDIISRIVNVYPEIVQENDPEMAFLSDIHSAMICLHHHAGIVPGEYYGTTSSTLDLEWLDQGTWKHAFPNGIPPAYSPEFWREIEPLVDLDLYVSYVDRGGPLSTMYLLINEWYSCRGNSEYSQRHWYDRWTVRWVWETD